MNNNARKARGGFTLIEVMAVITIIIILAGMVVGGLGFVNERQAKEKARVQIALLSKALEEYKLDMGRYPGNGENTPEQGIGQSEELYTALFYEGYEFSENPDRSDPENLKANRIYLPELDPRTSKLGWVFQPNKDAPPIPRTKILDPWGEEYRYRKGTNAENPDFDLWSTGKDAKTNVENPEMSQTDNKDDIRNF